MNGQLALMLLVGGLIVWSVLAPLPAWLAARRPTADPSVFDRHAEQALRMVAEVRR